MDSQHREQTERLEWDIRDLAGRFDRHLEIYAQNNKEIAALRTELNATKQNIGERLDHLGMLIKENRNIYAQKNDIAPIRILVYGFTGLLLTSVVGFLFLDKFQ